MLHIKNTDGLQDDMIDVFSDEAKSGKKGTDIVDGKCTWLIVTALELANEEQRRSLAESYGRENKESTHVVKQIYNELNLLTCYRKAEKKLANEIGADVVKISSDLNPQPFLDLIKILLYREK